MKQVLSLLAVVGLLTLPCVSSAQTVFFDNDSGDGTWETATNWSTDAHPNGSEQAAIGGGATTTLSTAGFTANFGDLDIAGDQSGATAGTLVQTDGTINVGGGNWIKIGLQGTGQFDIGGNAVFSGGDRIILNNGDANASATLNISGNASLTTNAISSGFATVNQTGGTVSTNNWIALGNEGAGTTSTYNISAGTVQANGDWFTVGENTTGILNISGSAVVEANGNGMIVTRNATGAVGTVTIDGSSASIQVMDLIAGLADDGVTDTGNIATLSWTADGAGVSTIVSAANTDFGSGATLMVDLQADANFSSWTTTPTGSLMDIAVLIDNAASVTGTFAGAAEGSLVNIGGGKQAFITYMGGDGNDVVLQSYITVVPEPASAGLVAVLFGAAMLRRRRS